MHAFYIMSLLANGTICITLSTATVVPHCMDDLGCFRCYKSLQRDKPGARRATVASCTIASKPRKVRVFSLHSHPLNDFALFPAPTSFSSQQPEHCVLWAMEEFKRLNADAEGRPRNYNTDSREDMEWLHTKSIERANKFGIAQMSYFDSAFSCSV